MGKLGIPGVHGQSSRNDTGWQDHRAESAPGAGGDVIAEVIHISSIEAADLAAVNGDSDLLDWSTPEFRTVATPEARKGVRLERAFWHALGVISAGLGLKRNKVIADVMQDASDRQLNVTSAIRSFAVRALVSELERTRDLCNEQHFLSLLLQAPVPSFAVDRNKRLLKVNGEFNQFLRILFAEIGDSNLRQGLQINLETPIVQVFSELGHSGESRQCTMVVGHGARIRRVRTRMVAVPPHDPTALVGYIIP
jgi:predicted DNA-binding ribbon-helix-helix protein